MTLQDAMTAARRQLKGGHRDAVDAAKVIASTGNSPLLNKWLERCALYGNKVDHFQLINFLAKDLRVKMRKKRPHHSNGGGEYVLFI